MVGMESEPRSAMIFQDIEMQGALLKHHKVLLSYESDDELLHVPITWSYAKFLEEVSLRFPQLEHKFTLIDADFEEMNEQSFNALKKSTSSETWLLVRRDDENTNEDQLEDVHKSMEKPRYELLKYDVHPNALTQSGNYHFSACYQAFCEFIDNAIQATSNNSEEVGRKIRIHIFLKQGIACVFDNGEGMSSEGLKAFASYFLSQHDRGLEPGSSTTFGYMDGKISKFGVGATQAGFYLGETIKVVTKRKESPFVTEIAISKEKLHERAKTHIPVFEDFKCIRNPGDSSTLDAQEAKCLKKLVEKELEYEHFTCLIIKHVQEKHLQYMHADSCTSLTRNLAHVYHYYMHGIRGRLKKLEFDRGSLKNFKEDTKPNVSIDMFVDKGNGNVKEHSLQEVKDDLESQYQIRLKSVFSFCLELKIPEVDTPQIVQGCLMYFPNESGDESLPTTKPIDGEDGKPDPMFECFWQGRLAPLSYVNRLDFCSKPDSRTRKQKDLLPDICYHRVRGLLFFNRKTPVSNNKLKILLDTRRDLSDAMSDAAASRGLPKYFQQWLEQCHRDFDREILYEHPLPSAQQPNNGDVFYGKLRVIHCLGEDIYASGDTVKIDTRPVAYGKAMYFIKKGKTNELGEIIYCRLPEEIYGDVMESRPVMRLAGKPDKAILNKVFAADMLLLPKSLKIHEGSDTVDEVNPKLEFHAGEEMKEKTNYWVTVYNGEKPPKAITELHQKKIGVKVEVCDITLNTLVQKASGVRNVQGRNPLINQVHIEKRYGFKPFYLDKEGLYEVKFSVLLANTPCMVEKKLEMKILPNVAEIVNLLDNSPDLVQLGEPCISFKLSFHDVYENNTCTFKNGDSVTISCTCDHLTIKGLQESYKPDPDGTLEVKNISVEPCGTQLSLTRDYEFWVIAEGIGDVMFPFRLLTGPPEKVQTTQLETRVFQNYENFPEFEVRLLDKWGQSSMIRDKTLRLALSCQAFSQMILLSTITNGKAKFPTTPIKIENLAEEAVSNVIVSLVLPDNQKKKNIIKKTLKELFCMKIQIKPSNICQQIKIVQIGNESTCNEDFLGLDAVAGTVVSNLKVVAYSENGQQLTDEQFLSQDPHLTCTWAEVNPTTLPLLPDCPITNIIQVNVHNVQCFCKYNGFEIRNEAKLRISVLSGEAVKWSFKVLKSTVNADEPESLTKSVKVIVLDKHHNDTSPTDGVIPYVTAEHTMSDGIVNHSGELELCDKEFIFSAQSILNGTTGQVSLFVQDQSNSLAKDSVTIQLLHGLPAKVFATCTAFEIRNSDPDPWLFMFTNQPNTAHLMCSIVDAYNNHVDLNKVSMTMEWIPPDAGNLITKKGTNKGEVIFPANVVKCLSGAGSVKIKISCPEMTNLEPFLINVQVLQCNRVSKIHVEVSDDENLKATSEYPNLKISHETEDGVLVSDVLPRFKIHFYKPSGKSINFNLVYPKLKRKVEDGVAIFQHCPEFLMEEAGNWNIQCQYTETREEIKQILKEPTISSNTINLKVGPGVTTRFKVNLPEDSILFASNTAEVSARMLLPPQAKGAGYPNKIELLAVDQCNNVSAIDTTIYVVIESAEEELRDDMILPEVDKACQQFKMKGGKLILSRIALKEKVGNDMGYYYLIFTNHVYQPCKIKFSFSTDVEVEKITQEMLPLKAEVDTFQKRLKDKQDEQRMKKMELLSHSVHLKRLFTSPEPKIRAIDDQLAKLRNEANDYECLKTRQRKCRKEANYPPHNVRQYIKGLVCELAYITDENHCRILSWFAQPKMRVALCETREQQKKVYDLGCPAYSKNLIFGFSKKGYEPESTGLLPIDLPDPPKNFKSPIDFAVNLLQFKEENKNLRSTLFWSVFHKTIVVKDIEHAQRYREHVIKMKQPCPSILTSQGDLLASDGLMDPGRRCPAKLDQLRYTFSELPPTERNEYYKLKEDIAKLEELRRVTFDLTVIGQEVQQYQLDLTNKQKSIMPLIREHEQKLTGLKRKAESIKNQTKKKRKT